MLLFTVNCSKYECEIVKLTRQNGLKKKLIIQLIFITATNFHGSVGFASIFIIIIYVIVP